MSKRLISLLIVLVMTFALFGCSTENNVDDIPKTGIDMSESNEETLENENIVEDTESINENIEENGTYTSPEDVALYLHTYGKLPNNFITKDEAFDLGWDSSKGNLWEITDNKSIGGDKFGNREGLLPKEKGRQYFECDVNYEGGFRGGERIIFSNDGLIFYTEDHYDSFEQLY